MINNKIYYNTEYRKKIKALSKFNIFIKDRISKKDEIKEARLKKKKELLIPLFYKNLFSFYNLIKFIYDKWIYKINYDLKLSLNFYILNYNLKKKNIYKSFNNQLILEYFFNGIIYFLLIVNWLWINEWNKWASLTDMLEYSFFSIVIMFQYINSYFLNFINYLDKSYKILLFSFFYDLNYLENSLNLYNIYSLNELYLFSLLYNVEEIKFEHDKNFVPKNKWKDLKKPLFNYLHFDILNNNYYISFFSFTVYENYIMNNIYQFHYITLTFFEYWVNCIIEKNVDNYIFFRKQKEKKIFIFNNYNLKNLYIKILKNRNFSIRIKYNLFLSNIDYFLFMKDLTYNFYIRNHNYFFEFASQRKLFLKYNNPTSINKNLLTIWDYDKLYKKMLLLVQNNINKNLNLFNINRVEPYFSFNYKKNNNDLNFLINLFFKNLNIKLLYKLNQSDSFFFSINKFFNFNLIDFYNSKNRLESYKNVMSINSVYEYRYANSSFKTMEEFILTIFKTPLENYIYFNDLYKELSYNIVLNIFNNIEKEYFFKDFFNFNNEKALKKYSFFLKYFNRLFKTRIYFFKFNYLFNLIKNEEAENLLKLDVFSRFYNIFENIKVFYLIHKFKRKNFYKRWSIKKFFNIIKYNSMFYLDIYNMFILYSGWLYENLFFFRFITFVKIYNKFLYFFQFYDYYRYTMNFKDFFFQLIYENIEYSLLYILIYKKKIEYSNNFNYINIKNKIINNFIYRKYMLYSWLEYDYFNDLFDDLDFFEKGNYSIKLSKWILRYFHKKSELYMFYSESLHNNYKNKKRLLI